MFADCREIYQIFIGNGRFERFRIRRHHDQQPAGSEGDVELGVAVLRFQKVFRENDQAAAGVLRRCC